MSGCVRSMTINLTIGHLNVLSMDNYIITHLLMSYDVFIWRLLKCCSVQCCSSGISVINKLM